MRGHFGIAVYRPKNSVNIGSLFRSAQLLGANYLAIIEGRYRRQPSDTMNATNSVPLYHFDSWANFAAHVPDGAVIIGVELEDDALLLDMFKHPARAVYLLGAEDDGIPDDILEQCHQVVKLRGKRSMNLAVAGSIVMYLRGLA